MLSLNKFFSQRFSSLLYKLRIFGSSFSAKIMHLLLFLKLNFFSFLLKSNSHKKLYFFTIRMKNVLLSPLTPGALKPILHSVEIKWLLVWNKELRELLEMHFNWKHSCFICLLSDRSCCSLVTTISGPDSKIKIIFNSSFRAWIRKLPYLSYFPYFSWWAEFFFYFTCIFTLNSAKAIFYKLFNYCIQSS